ncbi:PREDICTED: uncharacterized protein LOC104798777 isoform X2 [Tarenaya hassleriana]|uniref:uncharacterized protein LOC104798777 isoform X2 n=1 Tax=Tarenaya hassleriana TaxID=28532 RepID=UPI00053C0EEF|nr:PREDICTED: uncharacterized protein LOC104798777 isoform X2 [Tarenaya hassleriana]
MDNTQVESLEEKLMSLLRQLQAEHAVFERMVYKNKNQHRRCSYFQYLLKVRRDLRLLRTANMEETLRSCFHVIGETKPRQKMYHLESLKRRRCETGKPNLLEKLLGTLRLLSQMAEIILRAACEISTLLARSFFIGFSVTFLALLARLRILVQQILFDAVSIFNSVTSISRKKQVVKIELDGVEVFREFYPKDEDYITLDCVWKTDKFVLLETLQKREDITITKDQDVAEDPSSRDLSIQYHTLFSFLGEDASSLVEAEDKVVVRESSTSMEGVPSSETNNGTQQTEASEKTEDMPNLPVEAEKTGNAMEPPLKKPETSSKNTKEEDGFYNLLIRGTGKDSLF